MALRRWCREVAVGLLTASLVAGCSYAPDLTAPEVFVGGFANVSYQPFRNTQGSNVAVDSRETREGRNTLRVTVPDSGNPANQFAGGTFNSGMPRDLSGYDALTFWAQ